MNTKYIFEQYEITLISTSDQIQINILDTQLFKLYKKSYNDIHIIDYCPNINIFHTLLQTSFEALVNNDTTKADINITPASSHLIIHINHKFYVNFTFDLHLDLDTNNTLSAKDLCIKKLESEVKTLTTNFNILQYFIDEYMEVTICDDCASLKVNTSEIILIFNNNGGSGTYLRYNGKNTCTFVCGSQTKFNNNFKIIQCTKLTINILNQAQVITNCNLTFPRLLEKIIITHNSLQFLDYIVNINLTELANLKEFEFQYCYDLRTMYEKIKHLKIKKIRICNCANFQERELLLTHGYTFEVV